MYARVKSHRLKDGSDAHYVQLVECHRMNGKPRQKLVQSFGRFEGSPDELAEVGAALLRFARKLKGEAADAPSVEVTAARRHGEVAVLRQIWESLGVDKVLRKFARDRKFTFDLEHATFAMAAQRLIEPGSKLACVQWYRDEVLWPDAQGLDDDDLYATLSWLEGVKEDVEVDLYRRLKKRGALSDTAFFYDTTTTWFEGRGPEDLAAYGRPKGGQPRDRRIILMGLVRTREGWPITHRVFPGNTADVSTVLGIIDDLKDRFGVKRFVFVGDRGMVSKKVIAHLEANDLQYVLGMRPRTNTEVREKVLSRAGRYRVVADNLEVKAVTVDERRYVVCRNPRGVERDQKRREDILVQLRGKLGAKGVKAGTKKAATLQAHRAFRRYLEVVDGKLAVNDAKVADDARYDGKWVIRTNADESNAAELAKTYKQLARIERDFRDMKSFIELRPVHHYKEERVRGHVFVCVLAKLLMAEMERRLGPPGERTFTWPKAMKQLRTLEAVQLQVDGAERWRRAKPNDKQRAVLDALGVSERSLPVTLSAV